MIQVDFRSRTKKSDFRLRNPGSDRGRGGGRFSSKLRNSRRNEKIDLPCISVWGRTGL